MIKEINSIEDFINVRNYKNEYNVNDLDIKLNCDLDLTDVTILPIDIIFTGIFDGQNHKIINANFIQNKKNQGLLFNQIKNATIKNLIFFNCNIIGSNFDSLALVTGLVLECARFINIEIVSTSVLNKKNNYAALLFANQKGKGNIYIDRVKVYGLVYVSCAQYGGLLCGDIVDSSNVNIYNSYIDGVFETQNGKASILCGRIRGNNKIEVINTYVFGQIKSKFKLDNISYISSCSSPLNVKLDNVIFKDDSINLFDKHKPNNLILNNIHYINALKSENLDLKLNDKLNVKLSLISTSCDIYKLKLDTNYTKINYKEDEVLDLSNLKIEVLNSNFTISQIDISKTSISLIDSQENKIKLSSPLKEGSYQVLINYFNLNVSYTINVYKLYSLELNLNSVKDLYNVCDIFDLSKVYVYLNYKNGLETLKELCINFKTRIYYNDQIVSNLYKEGKYKVEISFDSYIKTFDIYVIDFSKYKKFSYFVNLYQKDIIEINKNHLCFKKISQALTFLSYLPKNEKKTLYINKGKYIEKLKISIPNLTLIGDSVDSVIIESDKCANELNDTLDKNLGTYNSSTIVLDEKAINFSAFNISIINSFDYYNTICSNRQALALMIKSDKCYLKNCKIKSIQDTLFVQKGRSCLDKCIIEGSIDFIFGEFSQALFKDCDIISLNRNMDKQGYVVAYKGEDEFGQNKVNYGLLFDKCNFLSKYSAPMSLARTWGNNTRILIANSYIDLSYSINEFGLHFPRYDSMSGVRPDTQKFKEFNNIGPSALKESLNSCSIIAEKEYNIYKENLFKKNNRDIEYEKDWEI